MGIMDRLKKVTGSNEVYDDNYEEDYYNGFDNNDGYADDVNDNDVQLANGPAAQYQPVGNQHVNMGPQGGISLSGANIKMQVVRPPQTYDTEIASQIANHLLNKCTVVLNLENTSKEASRRLIDFLSGVAYSIGGNLRRIATSAYVITPSNVDVGEAKVTQRKAEPQPEPEPEPEPDNGLDDFTDFN